MLESPVAEKILCTTLGLKIITKRRGEAKGSEKNKLYVSHDGINANA